MAITTPNMGLKRWDQPNDIFSYTELSDNFNLLDLHDHTSTKGVQIPTNGLANSAVTTTKLANDSVTDAKVVAATLTGARLANTTIGDGKLISPNSGLWKTVWQGSGVIAAAAVTASGVFWYDNAAGTLRKSAVDGGTAPTFWFGQLSDYALNSKTTQVRHVTHLLTNPTAPGVTVTPAVYNSSTHSFSGSNVILTLGTAYGASGFGSPGASQGLTAYGTATDLSTLTTNFWLVGISFGGALAGGSVVALSSRIEMRHV